MVTLAKVRVAQGKLDRAHEIIDEAKRTTDDDSYRSLAKGLLTVQGRIEKESGNLTAAWTSLLRALKATEDTESWMSIGSRHIDLGHVALEQDQLDQAADHFEQGLKSSQEYHRQDNIAKAKFGLARVLVLRGNKPEAIERALSAREQFVRMDMEREIREVDDFLCQMEYSEEQYE
jgi:tetratricopeptide (TPR) repeat protein